MVSPWNTRISDPVYVGQNIRNMLQPLLVFKLPPFNSALGQRPRDMLSMLNQLSIDSTTYIFLLRWFCLAEAIWVAYNGFCVTALQISSRKSFNILDASYLGQSFLKRPTSFLLNKMKDILFREENITVFVFVFCPHKLFLP